VQRLNADGRGVLLGAFSGDDRILTLMQGGFVRLTTFDLSTHFDEEMIRIEKYDPERIYTVIYQDTKTKLYYVKRFKADLTDRKVEFLDEGDKLILQTSHTAPSAEIQFDMKLKTKGSELETVNVTEFIGVKGIKARGKRLTGYPVKKIAWVQGEEEQEEMKNEEMTKEEMKKEEKEEIRKAGKEMKREEKEEKEVIVEIKKKRGRKPKITGTESGSGDPEPDDDIKGVQMELPL